MRVSRIFLTIILLICSAQAFAKVDLDLSEPKAAARTFIKAIIANDVQTARAASTADEKQVKWIESFANLISAFQSLDQAMVEKFGNPTTQEADTDPLAGMRAQNILSELETMRVQIKDDTARLLPPKAENELVPSDEVERMALKKVDGQWKVDISSIADGDPANLEQANNFAKGLRKLTEGVKQGKYKSRQEVISAILSGKIDEEQATTRPAPDKMD